MFSYGSTSNNTNTLSYVSVQTVAAEQNYFEREKEKM